MWVAVAAATVGLLPSAASAEAAPVHDGFERADGPLGSSDSGHSWTSHVGAWRVAAGAAAPGDGGYALASVDTGSASGRLTVTASRVSTELWIVLRLSDSRSYWRFGRWRGGAYQLQQVTGNALGTPMLTSGATPTPADGDVLSCRAGRELACAVNGVEVVRTLDAFNAAATRFGIAAADAATRLDHLSFAPSVAPDLRVGIADSADPVVAGRTVTYVVTAANNAPVTAREVSADIPVPQGASFVSAEASQQGPCALTSGTVRCPLGDIEGGASANVTVVLRTNAVATLVVTPTVVASAGDAHLADNSDTEHTTVVSDGTPSVSDSFERPDGPLGTSDSGHPWRTHTGGWSISAGTAAPASIGYSLASVDTASDTGVISVAVPQVSAEQWVVVRLSDGANYWRFGRWRNGPYELQLVAANQLRVPLLTLGATVTPAAGDVLSCRVTKEVACSVNGVEVARASDDFNLTATRFGLAALGSGTAPARFDDLTFTPTLTEADLRLSMTDAVDPVVVGHDVTYRLTVTNNGPVAAQDAVVENPVPEGADFVSASASHGGGCALSSGHVVCPLGDVPAGDAATLSVRFRVTAGTMLVSTAAASLAGPDAFPGDNTASESTSVHPAPASSRIVDSFDREEDQSLGVSDSGHPWMAHGGAWRATGGAARPGDTLPAVASVGADSAFGTYTVTVVSALSVDFALLFGVVDARNHFRVGYDPAGSGYYRVYRVVDGGRRPLEYSFHRRDVVPQDGDVVRVVTRPDDGVYVSVNGVHVFDGGDRAWMDTPRFGLWARTAGAAFDALTVSPVLSSSTTVDTFSRATAGELGTPESGARYPWRSASGTAWAITDSLAHHSGSGYGLAVVDVSSEAAAVRVTLTRAGPEQWVVFRYGGYDSYYRFGSSGGSYTVQRVANFALAPVPGLETLATVAPRDGNLLEIRQQLDGRVECLVDGVVTHRFSDAAFNLRALYYGLASYGSAARFDDFSVTPQP